MNFNQCIQRHKEKRKPLARTPKIHHEKVPLSATITPLHSNMDTHPGKYVDEKPDTFMTHKRFKALQYCRKCRMGNITFMKHEETCIKRFTSLQNTSKKRDEFRKRSQAHKKYGCLGTRCVRERIRQMNTILQ